MYSSRKISFLFKYLGSIGIVLMIFSVIGYGQSTSVKKIGTAEQTMKQLPRLGIFSAATPVSKNSSGNTTNASMFSSLDNNMEPRGTALNVAVQERMDEVLELIRNKKTMSESAQKLKISENEMKAYYSGFMHKGKSGLMTHAKANLRDFANRFNGRWVMSSRVVGGQKTSVTADMYFNLALNSSGTKIVGELFVIETGRFDSKVCKLGPGEIDGEPFIIAAYINAEGSLAADSSVDWRFEGEVQGSYGAYRNGLRTPKMQTNYYNFGESYTAIAPVVDDPQTKGKIEIKDTDFDDIYVEGETMSLKSTGFDVIDTYHRVEPEAKAVNGIWGLHDYFNMLKSSGTLSRTPAVWDIKRFPDIHPIDHK